MQRGRVGLDGAESEICDLSGRHLTTSQAERTLRVFSTASTVDLSNNEIDVVPASLPTEVLVLDLSFNLIADPSGIERFQYLEELHLAFNRLVDVSILELCPRLLRVNLSGNRLTNTKGLESLIGLEQLDISENLIEYADALRPLSLNQNLTHLILRGNPISFKADYRVLMLDMVPSVLMLDDKKIRATTRNRAPEGPFAKSLSYSRIYDDKKLFVIRKPPRRHPGTRAQVVLPGDATTAYDGTIFLRPASDSIQEKLRGSHESTIVQRDDDFLMCPPPAPSPSSMVAMSNSPCKQPPSSGPYISLYERLAQSSGMQLKSNAPPSRPIVGVKPIPSATAKCKIEGASKKPGHDNSPPTLKSPTAAFPKKDRTQASSSRSPRGVIASRERQTHLSPTNQDTVHVIEDSRSVKLMPSSAPLNEKQRNVLNVINNLIQHKRQTIQTLGRQPPPPRARGLISNAAS